MKTSIDYKDSFELLKDNFTHKNAKGVFRKNENSLAYTLGNKKIGEDTLILNMGSAHACPSAKLGLCDLALKKHGGDGSCYALKAEYFYPNSLPFRTLQHIQWVNFSAAQIADEIFSIVLKKSKSKTPIKFVRYNESGDFYSIEDVRKASKVAAYVAELCDLANVPLIRFYTYTHRSDIFKGNSELVNSLSKNFTINGSNFKVHNEFRVLDISREERDVKIHGKKVNKYTCLDDCNKCSLCKVHGKSGITIIQAIH